MANDLVVNLGARLDQFGADLDQAGSMADSAVASIEKSFASLNPGINLGSLTTALAAGAAGFTALMATVTALNNGLSEMAKQADRVGLSYQRFQQLKFGAAAIGVGDKAFGADMEAFVAQAQSALAKANDLKRVFDANKVSITDANGKLKETNALFESAVDIIKRAPKLSDALEIGKYLGLSKEFAQGIYDAGDNFLRLASTANSVGAVIDDATIAKAKTFTDEWNKASAVWGAQMKAATLEFLPLINDAIAAARSLMTYVAMAADALRAIKDFAITPNVDTASLDKLQSLYDQTFKIREKLEGGAKLDPIELFQASNAQENGEITLASLDKYLALLADRILNFNKSGASRIQIRTDASVNPGAKPQAADERLDQFERQVEQIEKRAVALNADTAATFQNATAQAQLRAEFALLNAVTGKRGEVTQAQLDKYMELRASMSATQALQQSGITLTKEHGAAFESASKQIAASTEANTKAKESLRQLNAVSQLVGSSLSTAFADAILEGKKLNEVASNLVKTLARAAINWAIMAPFMPGAGGGTSLISKVFGFAEGTASAPGGLAVVGEKGPELVNLPKGSQVIPADITRGIGGITAAPVFNIDARGASVEAVARLAEVVGELKSTMPSTIIATVQQARRGRVPGL